MLVPVEKPLVCVRGRVFDVDFEFWTDAAATQPWSLAGVAISFEIPDLSLALSVGSGITIQDSPGHTGSQNLAHVELDDAETLVLQPRAYRYNVRVPRSGATSDSPVAGPFTVRNL